MQKDVTRFHGKTFSLIHLLSKIFLMHEKYMMYGIILMCFKIDAARRPQATWVKLCKRSNCGLPGLRFIVSQHCCSRRLRYYDCLPNMEMIGSERLYTYNAVFDLSDLIPLTSEKTNI